MADLLARLAEQSPPSFAIAANRANAPRRSPGAHGRGAPHATGPHGERSTAKRADRRQQRQQPLPPGPPK